MSNSRMARVGEVMMSEHEINELLEAKTRFVVCYKKVYHLEHVNYKPEFIPFYGRLIHTSPEPLIRRCSYEAMNAEGVNKLIGQELFTD